jgi:hypothetical protein
VNDHACLSAAQREWPKQTLENPDGSPLLAVAACIRGYKDCADYSFETNELRDDVVGLFDKLLFWAAEMLEKLESCLRKQFGEDLWHDPELDQFSRKE